MAIRNKVIKKKFIKTKFCDSCLKDLDKSNIGGSCANCKKDLCNECIGTKIDKIILCKECDGLCRGCNEYSNIQIMLDEETSCPNCGYILKK